MKQNACDQIDYDIISEAESNDESINGSANSQCLNVAALSGGEERTLCGAVENIVSSFYMNE